MAESPAPSKFAKWLRPLIGGLLSAGIAWSFLSAGDPLIGIGFYSIPFMLLNSILSQAMNQSFETQVNFISLLFWFPIGAAIAYFIKDNRKAIFRWLLLCIIFYIIGYPLLILMWGNG